MNTLGNYSRTIPPFIPDDLLGKSNSDRNMLSSTIDMNSSYLMNNNKELEHLSSDFLSLDENIQWCEAILNARGGREHIKKEFGVEYFEKIMLIMQAASAGGNTTT